MYPSPLGRISRRQLLIGGGAVAGAVLLGACGSDDDAGSDEDTTTTTGSGGPEGLALAQFFGGPLLVAGRESRMPFGVSDRDGLLSPEDTPAELEVQVLAPDGQPVGDPITVARHHAGLPRAYFPLKATIEVPGLYTARTEIDGTATEMSFQILDAADVRVIQPGAAMPAVDTPTTADPRGVKPICTNDPVCPLHDVSLPEVLGQAPVALLVATPAFCQLAICGPVLDVLLDAAADFPTVRFLHAEVYVDPAKDLERSTPIVEALGLHFEPCLVLIGADGTVAERVDIIYDDDELHARLDALAQR
jgi:hypothetical protein